MGIGGHVPPLLVERIRALLIVRGRSDRALGTRLQPPAHRLGRDRPAWHGLAGSPRSTGFFAPPSMARSNPSGRSLFLLYRTQRQARTSQRWIFGIDAQERHRRVRWRKSPPCQRKPPVQPPGTITKPPHRRAVFSGVLRAVLRFPPCAGEFSSGGAIAGIFARPRRASLHRGRSGSGHGSRFRAAHGLPKRRWPSPVPPRASARW